MWAGFCSLPREASGSSRKSRAPVGSAASGLGLVQYPPIDPSDRPRTREASESRDVADARSLLYLVHPSPRLPARARSARTGGMASVIFHIAVASIVIALAAWSRSSVRSMPSTMSEPRQVPRLVFLLQPGPRGGGGGGGTRQETRAPSKAQAPGRDRFTVAISRAERQASRSDDASRQQQVLLDAKPLEAGNALFTGVPEASPSLPFSRGPGDGEGAGGGTGSGIGLGTAPGIGPGSGGGFGGGAYRVGRGVVAPTLLKQVTPKYTADALRQRIQGVVALEVVVGREGTPTAIRVTRSLDAGLDEEAVAAVRQWRFVPGRVGDAPVDVLVTVLLDFNVR